MSPEKKSPSVQVVLAALGIAGLFCIGTVAAIAVPNFLKFGARSKQSECKSNLRALYIAQRAFFLERDVYSTDAAMMGFAPEMTRYAYLIAPGQVVAPNMRGVEPRGLLEATPAGVRQAVGVKGTCPDCFATMACSGNIDGDPAVDVWTVSTIERVIGGEKVPAGEPHHDRDDLAD